MGEWKAHVEQPIMKDVYRIYLFKDIEARARQFVTKGGEEYRTVQEGDITEKNFCLIEVPSQAMHSIVDAIDRSKIPKPSKSHTEGKLEATLSHLEDMRSIVFKGKK